MVELFNNSLPQVCSKPASPRPPSPPGRTPATPQPAPGRLVTQSHNAPKQRPTEAEKGTASPLRSRPSALRRIIRQPNPADVVSKINLLDLATEITAVIFRYAHKPKDLLFLLPSGAGPLIPRKYNLPLTVSKEWYRRARPIYYETLRLTWPRIPEFTENIQRYEILACYIQSIHVKLDGTSFYKAVRSQDPGRRGDDAQKVTPAQLYMWAGQFLDSPLATFALCIDSLVCIRDLTLRFTEFRGTEVSLQTIASIIINLPPCLENLYLDCAAVGKQTSSNPYPVHLCPILRRHGTNLKSIFLSCRFLCQDLFHPDLIPNWEPPEDEFSALSILSPLASYPQLESFTVYREGRNDPTPRPCSEMYIYGHRKPIAQNDWPRQFIDYAVQAYRRGSFPSIKRFEIPSSRPPSGGADVDAFHPDGKPCSSVFDVLQDDNYWNSNEEIVIDEEVDGEDEEWTLPERWWKSRRRGMDRR